MKKQISFDSKDQVALYRQKIINNIDKVNKMVQDLFETTRGIEFIKHIKFEKSSYDTLFEEPTNFIEQINQTSTYLVCLAAVDHLISIYPQHRFLVNFGTTSGYDVVSDDGSIICECFAVTSPDSNGKLKKDAATVYSNDNATNKYVIFYASTPKQTHVENIRKNYPGVDIIALDNI